MERPLVNREMSLRPFPFDDPPPSIPTCVLHLSLPQLTPVMTFSSALATGGSQAIVNLILDAIRGVQSTRYSELASSTIIIWDHLITIDQEVELIWNAHWSIGKCLFIINRYYALCCVVFNNYALFTTTLSDSFCIQWFQWQGWTGLATCMIAEIILQVRLYALYFLNKKVLALMVTCFIGTSVASAIVLSSVFSEMKASSHILPGVPVCVPLGVPSHLYAFWIPMIAFESMLCGMALYRGFQGVFGGGALFRCGRHLVDILVQDSIVYFLVVFASYATNLLINLFGSDSIKEIPLGFSVAMSCIMGNRLILNVRCLHKQLTDPTTTTTDGFEPTRDEDVFQRYSSSCAAITSADEWSPSACDVEMAQLRPTCVPGHYGDVSTSSVTKHSSFSS
jgi:hypothetical protein